MKKHLLWLSFLAIIPTASNCTPNVSEHIYEYFDYNDNSEVKKIGLITGKCEVIIKPTFDNIDNFKEGLAKIGLNGKSGFIDKKGNIVVKPIFNSIGSFFEGLINVNINGKWGFLDKKGNMIIKPTFTSAWDFSNGLGLVQLGQKYLLINKKGETVFSDIESVMEKIIIFKDKNDKRQCVIIDNNQPNFNLWIKKEI